MNLKSKKTALMLSLLVILDAAVIAFSHIFAWWLRFPLNVFNAPYREAVPLFAYLEAIPFVVISWITILSFMKSYGGFLEKNTGEYFREVVKAVTLGTILNASITFVWREYSFSRLVLVYAWIIALALLLLARIIVKSIWKTWLKSGIGFTGVVLVGSPQQTAILRARISSGTEYRVMETIEEIPGKGFLEKVSAAGAEEVIAALPVEKWKNLDSIAEECIMAGLRLRLISDLLNVPAGRVAVGRFHGMASLEFGYGLLDRWNRSLKRFFDVLFSITTAALSLPLVVLIFIAVIAGSRGPVFFRQKRLGKGCRETWLLKFRSMRADAEYQRKALESLSETAGPIFKISKDPRVTPVGKFLRKYYLDELPQVWNVMCGEMSWVGPRPLPVDEAVKVNENCRKRILARPGITGLWQTSPSVRFSAEEMMKMDAYYVNNWSLALDLKILIKSIYTVFSGKGL